MRGRSIQCQGLLDEIWSERCAICWEVRGNGGDSARLVVTRRLWDLLFSDAVGGVAGKKFIERDRQIQLSC